MYDVDYADGEYGFIQGSRTDKHVYMLYKLCHTYASDIVKALKTYFDDKDRKIFIDIGAHIGLVTIPISKLNNIICHCFEPNTRNYFHLVSNINHHNADNIEVYNVALMDEDKDYPFLVHHTNHGDCRIKFPRSDITEDQTEDIVIGRKLDNYVYLLEKDVAVAMKMDAQGVENYIVRGGMEFLKSVDFLVMEYWPYGLKNHSCDPIELLDILGNMFPYCEFLVDMYDGSYNKSIKNFMNDLPKKNFGGTGFYDLVFSREPFMIPGGYHG